MDIKKIFNFLRSSTIPQISNYLRFILSNPSPYLPYRPVHLSLYITSRCNLGCNMCPYQQDSEYKPAPYNDMSFERFRQIIEKFKEAHSLTLTAEGEPFLNTEIFRMIEHAANKYKMRVISSTNGTVIEDKIEKIVNSDLSELNISLDGVNSEEYYCIRGENKKAYDKIVNNISRLVETRNNLKSNLKISVSYIITIHNYKQIPEMISLAEGLDVNKVHLQNLIGFGTKLSDPRFSLYADKEVITFLQDTMQKFYKSKLEIIFPTPYSREGHKKICMAPFRDIGINTRGDINLCCNLGTNEKYGNIFKESDVWNNKQFQKARKAFLNRLPPFPLCKFCPATHLSL